MRFLLFFLVVLLCGCLESGSVVENHNKQITNYRLPPTFNLGDSVALENGQVGIVIRQVSYNDWHYDVIFQTQTIRYAEGHLELVERYDWSRSFKEGIYD